MRSHHLPRKARPNCIEPTPPRSCPVRSPSHTIRLDPIPVRKQRAIVIGSSSGDPADECPTPAAADVRPCPQAHPLSAEPRPAVAAADVAGGARRHQHGQGKSVSSPCCDARFAPSGRGDWQGIGLMIWRATPSSARRSMRSWPRPRAGRHYRANRPAPPNDTADRTRVGLNAKSPPWGGLERDLKAEAGAYFSRRVPRPIFFAKSERARA